MHLPTHILAGWAVANALPLSPRQRLAAMAVSALPDLDVVSIVGGMEAYWRHHHVLGHNLLVGVLLSVSLTLLLSRRWWMPLFLLALFHLHLLMDVFGSGPLWSVSYWWPISSQTFASAHAWEFFSWQNITAGYGLVGIAIAIAIHARRTPLELLMPSLDQKLVEFFRRVARRPEPSRPSADREMAGTAADA